MIGVAYIRLALGKEERRERNCGAGGMDLPPNGTRISRAALIDRERVLTDAAAKIGLILLTRSGIDCMRMLGRSPQSQANQR